MNPPIGPKIIEELEVLGYTPTGISRKNGVWSEVHKFRSRFGDYFGIKINEENDETNKLLVERNQTLDEITAREAIKASHVIVPRHVSENFTLMPWYEKFLPDILEDGLGLLGKDRAIHISKGILHSLAYLHKEIGIIHGDLKPDNVALDYDETPLLNDFGVAKPIINNGQDADSQRGGEYVRSPESWAGKSITSRSDVWSAAALIGKLFTGKYPFQDVIDNSENPEREIEEFTPTIRNSFERARYTGSLRFERWPISPFLWFHDEVPSPYRKVLRKALSQDPSNRFKDAKEFEDAFIRADRKDTISRIKGPKIVNIVSTMMVLGPLSMISYYAMRDAPERELIEYQNKFKTIEYFINADPDSMEIRGYESQKAQGELERWTETFDDEHTAIAAYLAPHTIYEAVERANGKSDYKTLEPIIEVENPRLYEWMSDYFEQRIRNLSESEEKSKNKIKSLRNEGYNKTKEFQEKEIK